MNIETQGNEADLLFAIQDAQVVRAGKTILDVSRFSLRRGECVALLGPNGAGKSTFVQLLTREVLPLHKEPAPVVFRGSSRPLRADVKACFGIVTSSMHDQLKRHVPAVDIVIGGLFGTLGLPLRAHVTDAHKEKALQAMAELGIAHLAQQDAATLSTGQARRLLIAREMAHDPDAFIFDEPCTGLDPEGMYYVRRAMRRISQEGKTLVLVTHYAEDIVPEIDRVVFIKDARLVADGPKARLLSSSSVSDLFGVPLVVQETEGWHSLRGLC